METSQPPQTLVSERISHLFRRLEAMPDRRALKKKIIVLSTPRSGSSYFCDAMAGTGKLGLPKEWLNLRYMETFARLAGDVNPLDMGGYLDYLYRKSTTENGVFSINVHVSQYREWLEKGFDVLSMGFDLVVYLHRADRIAQAVSYARAIHTDQWSANNSVSPGRDPADVNVKSVLRMLSDLAMQIDVYNQNLAHLVDYEFEYTEFVTSIAPIQTIAERCGVEVTDVPEPDLKIQRDDFNRKLGNDVRKFLGVDSL